MDDPTSFRSLGPLSPFASRAVAVIRSIPAGRVATYGQIAALAGNPRAARQVARLLHAASRTRDLPWHRVINAAGRISLPRGGGYEEQRARLVAEGVEPGLGDRIDLASVGWRPDAGETFSTSTCD